MKTLLWIDDDEKLIDASIPVFLNNSFSILKATNTSRALSILREEELDGVLLDVRLRGGEDGLELLQGIRRLYPTLKVAIFTGYPEYDDHVHSEELGASAYLEKIKKAFPLDPEKQHRFFQALHKVFPAKPSQNPPASKSKDMKQRPTANLWTSGLFFLLLVAVVIASIGILAQNVTPWVLPIALIAGILLIVIVGGLVLRAQGEAGLSQRNFVTLILETLKLVPLLRKESGEDVTKANSTDEAK